MATLLKILNAYQNLNVNEVSEDALEATTQELRKRQRGQMESGKNAYGEIIGRYRNPAYARKKQAMNPKPGLGNVDLKLTGATHRDIYSEVRGNKVIIDSTNEKTQKLAEKYGEQIFGLSPEVKKDYINEDLRPVFIRVIKKALG